MFLGAGTQFFTAGFTALPFMKPYLSEGLAAATMGAGWLINALVAEWILRKPQAAARPGSSEIREPWSA